MYKRQLPFGIKDYFHESNDAVAWNNDILLGTACSIHSSTVVYFSFEDSNALFNSDFFALPDPSIPYLTFLCRYKKRTYCRTFKNISKVAKISFIEVEEIRKKSEEAIFN